MLRIFYWEQRKFKMLVNRESTITDDIRLPRVEYEDISSNSGKLNKNIYLKDNNKRGNEFEPNDILFGKLRPYLNKWLYATFKGIAVGDFGVLRTKELNSKYIFYLLQTSKFKNVSNISTGTKMPRADWTTVSNKTFIVPTNLNESERIGILLSTLDAYINLHQRKINTLKEQKKAYFRRVLVGKSENKPILRFKNFYGKWSNDKLENLFEYGGSGGTPKSTVKEYYEGNIPFLSISDISNSDGYINRTEKSISQKGLDNSAAWIVPKGAMSLAMYASVGKLAILNIEVATSQAFYNMVFKDDNLRDFVYQSLLKTNELNGWDSLVSTGTQRNLNANKVKNFTLSVPSNTHELIKVSKLLMNIDKVIDFHQSKLDNLIKLKTVYLNKMFI